MNNVEFLSIEIDFRTTWNTAKLMGAINLGAVMLKKDDREFILDPLQTTFTHPKGGGTNASCELDNLEDTMEDFPECVFDLTESDLMTRKFDTKTMFIEFEDHAEEDYASDVESITLTYKIGGCTYVVDLEPETFEIVE